MNSYHSLINSKYDSAAASKALTELLSHPKDPAYVENALLKALPVIGCVLRSHFRWLSPSSEAYEEGVSSCSYKLYTLFLSDRYYKKFYPDEKTQFAYLYQICKFEIISVLNRLNKDHQASPTIPAGLLNLETSESGIYCRVVAKEIPKEVYRQAVSLVRFTGEERELCSVLLASLVQGTGIPVVLIRARWGTTNLKFFANYSRVLIRKVLLDMKGDIGAIPSVLEVEEARFQELITQNLLDSNISIQDDLDYWSSDEDTYGAG